ncbi:hypothetical protein SLS60_000148 [Paraconiothyrium brasiliense]|uniref:FAD-binding domain-containing protein n=1 Tax=Paraconiothyrium brasiliense TaxID=300254 RepID=A0ABR3S5H8_9PLEO
MDMTAVVIGGSLSGLMHAIMLRDLGSKVTVVEQEISDSRRGYDAGIRAGPDVVKFLEKYDRTNSKYHLHAATQFVNKKDKPIFKSAKMMAWTSWGFLWSILRKHFDSLETSDEKGDKCPSAFMQGRRVTGLKDLGSRIEVQVDDLISHSTSSIDADIVIVADGTNSTIREQLLPNAVRKYAGYVSWRGVIPEAHVPEEYRQVFEGRVTFHLMHRSYIIVYVIPTDDGDMEVGKRMYNFVWYVTASKGSKELHDIMTDVDGHLHQGTVPRGLVRSAVWDEQRAKSVAQMPPCIAHLLEKTEKPFVSKIYDITSSKGVFHDGKVFLVGDALATFRPHIGLSTNQGLMKHGRKQCCDMRRSNHD